jgi:hypothetical protein
MKVCPSSNDGIKAQDKLPGLCRFIRNPIYEFIKLNKVQTMKKQSV